MSTKSNLQWARTLDGDIEEEHVQRYDVNGYPNILVVDPASGSATPP